MFHLELDRTKKRSYANQIYAQIRERILSGSLVAREALPSTRHLAKELCVARNTVLTAYDMLISEGLVLSTPGAGFYIGFGAAHKQPPQRIENYRVASLADDIISDHIIDFDSGIPALDLFPRGKWNRAVSRAFSEAPDSALGYDNPQGRPEFRAVLSAHLKKSRGIHCHPDQIIVTSGVKQALTLVAKCLLQAGSEVWIEDPSNDNVRRIFSYHTRKIIPFEVDAEGIQTVTFPHYGQPALIFITPSHQFPMGGTLSIQRRIELVRFAREKGCYLLEDDYDSEFTYRGLPPNSLFELDAEHVIHTGTFSKTMFPSLRLGYLVVPISLIRQIREWKRLADHHSNSIYQLALMRFIENGDLQRHIRRMKKEYQKRRDFLLTQLRSLFKENVSIYGEHAGMHIVAEFKNFGFTEESIRQLYQSGVRMIPVEKHAIFKGKHHNRIILGYAQLAPEQIKDGLQILKTIMQAT